MKVLVSISKESLVRNIVLKAINFFYYFTLSLSLKKMTETD